MTEVPKVSQQDPALYAVPAKCKELTMRDIEDSVIVQALAILAGRIRNPEAFHTPAAVRTYLSVKFAGLEHEVFSVVFLDSQNRMLEIQEMFRGTVSQTSVYPREVVKEALKLNASAVIFSHNHPSGDPTPSRADEHLTQTLKSALALVDVRVVDHIIVAGGKSLSMAEDGLI